MQQGDVHKTYADIDRTKEVLGWEPKTTIEEGIHQFIAWYREYTTAEARRTKKKIAIVGLGYVGLPLAVALGKHFPVVGFDVNEQRIDALRKGMDATREVSEEELRSVKIDFTAKASSLKEVDFIIVCVPTPIDQYNKPDLKYMESSSKVVGENIKPGTIVVYESTVYPGVTEEVCVPIIEKFSGLKCGVGFKVGYSPERINPGDKKNTIDKVVKIVSGMDKESLDVIDSVYSTITKTHRAPTIKVAEAAKVIENIQRDLNIALMNELAIIFDRMKINTSEVLEAAGTKWNFHHYKPGLVGGHCIGVDPYYLTYKAQGLGYHPDVILAGRRINDDMHKFYAGKVLRILARKERLNLSPSVLVLGLTFKPNVADYRNSRVKHFITELQDHNVRVVGYDPLLSREVVEKEFGLPWHDPIHSKENFNLIVYAVDHDELRSMVQKGNFNYTEIFYLKNV
ncbi:nucleotide sugar dehydrogenase [Candidatus Woesearchaeota archaeon]|nr:nucleotide sugar dehydrogenase [Candidatus Woesearchaeota archaeon]